MHMPDTITTGTDLKRLRTSHRFKLRDIAAAMGVSVSRVSNLERELVVSDKAAERYRAALLTCLTRAEQAA